LKAKEEVEREDKEMKEKQEVEEKTRDEGKTRRSREERPSHEDESVRPHDLEIIHPTSETMMWHLPCMILHAILFLIILLLR
jgi:hypothetical protein